MKKYSNYFVVSLMIVCMIENSVQAHKEELLEKFSLEMTFNNLINYEDFKNACDVLFVHTNSENQHFDPTWFRAKNGKKNSTQKMLFATDPSMDQQGDRVQTEYLVEQGDLVQPGDLVFVRRPNVFFTTVHPHIRHPYIIVTHGNSYSRFKRQYSQFLDDPKIIAWFSIHTGNKVHPKLYPLPLGVRKLPHVIHKGKKLSLHAFFKKVRKTTHKEHLVYMNFLDRTHPERKIIKEMFAHKPFCLREDKVDFETFMNHIAQSKFTFAPRGVGPADSFRIWESLMVGSIPLVKKSKYMDMCLYEELPVLIVDSWETVTESFLEEAYEAMSGASYATEKLSMGYWLRKIFMVRDQFLKQNKLARRMSP